MRVSLGASLSACSVLLSVGLSAQQPAPPAPKPDSPDITRMIERLKQDVGRAGPTPCTSGARRLARTGRRSVIPPTKIFDDVFAIGNSGTTVYVLRTSAGLLMIDALGAGDAAVTTAQLESQLLPGFQAARTRSGAGQDRARHARPRRSLRRCLVLSGALRVEGVRLGGRLEPDGESAGAWRAADAARRARRRRCRNTTCGYRRRPDDHARRSDRDGGRRARTYTRLDGVHFSREGQRQRRT